MVRKKLSGLVLLAAVAVLPFPLQGQQTIKASARVKSAIRHISSQAMDFGEMDPAAATVTDRVVSLLSTGVDPMDGNAGTLDYRLNKTGQGFTFSMPTELTSTTTAATLAVASWECGMEVGTTPSAITDPAATAGLDAYDAGGTCATQLNADLTGALGSRMVRLYIGGTIASAAFEAAPAETFEADITVTAVLP